MVFLKIVFRPANALIIPGGGGSSGSYQIRNTGGGGGGGSTAGHGMSPEMMEEVVEVELSQQVE